MSLTVTSQAAAYYNMYTFENSDTYTENAVDETTVSEDSYNISSLSNAIDAFNKSDSTNIGFIDNVTSYAKNVYETSQLSVYDTLTADNSVSDILSNNTDLSNLYELSGTYSMSSATYLASLSVASSTETDTSSSISSYLDDSSSESVLDVLA